MSGFRCAVIAALLVACPLPAAAQSAGLTSDLLDAFRFRSIGPAVTGGRIHDIEALPNDPSTVYVATATGGLWKTTNKGTMWTPIFDDQPVSTFGDVAIAASDPSVIWAGTGEQNNRQSTSWGNGVYRSTDGGRTWTHTGLDRTRHIGRIRVRPDDPAVAYVAALGNMWKPGPERGVFRTRDGGQTWEKILYVDTLTGAVDLAMDPSNPDLLLAATYQRLRRPWGFNGGGPGSGIYRTTDGGATWQRVAGGLPAGDLGRIGLAFARSDPRIVYAIVQHATAAGVYRSEDSGATWTRVNPLAPRPSYYSHIFVDPTDAGRVYVLGTEAYRSDDGGHTFHTLPTNVTYDVGVHTDFHALWIDPSDTRHLYLGSDGGLYESWDRGESFIKIDNLPIGQFYDIAVDNRDPYFIYGGLQDNHSWMGPGATRHWAGILNDDWRQIGFSDGMYQQVDPTSPRYIYSNSQGGSFTRVDGETGDILDITPRPPAGEPPYRWDWTSPSLLSRHDPKTLYVGGNRLFISHDRGQTWERTDDLTRQIDRDTLSIMGVTGSEPMLSKNDGTESFGEIVTISESPADSLVLWAGTDDGNVQLSADGGKSWTELSGNIRDVRDGTYVSRVLASAAGPAVAYVAFDAHRDGDFAPYLFRTTDSGRTWTPLTAGLPPDGSIRAIAEDPTNPGVLYAGTEHGLFASADAGRNWIPFRANLPTTLYMDIVIQPRDHDIILATHGRSLWVLDDARPLADWSPQVAAAPAYLFAIRPATLFQYWKDTSYRGHAEWAGENPKFGALLTYYLRDPAPSARIVVTNTAGTVVRTMDVPVTAGMHRVAWDLRHEPPPAQPRAEARAADGTTPQPIGPRGALVSPDTYTVALEVGTTRVTQPLEVRPDPLLPLTLAQYRDREAFLVQLAALQRSAFDARQRIEPLLESLTTAADSATGPDSLAARTLADSARALNQAITSAARSLDNLAEIFNGSGAQQGSLQPPTDTHRRLRDELAAHLEQLVARLDGFETEARSASRTGPGSG